MITVLLTGFITGLGLIVAIGPQNFYLLKQGIKKKNHLLIATMCSFTDALLITLGVLGVGKIVKELPGLIVYSSLLGALLLTYYGIKHIILAYKAEIEVDEITGYNSVKKTILMTLGITFFNPHIYLDTIVLLGSMSTTFPGSQRYYFGIGAILASFVWFYSLALLSEKLSPLFTSKTAWRILDSSIAIIMFIMVFKLGQIVLNGGII